MPRIDRGWFQGPHVSRLRRKTTSATAAKCQAGRSTRIMVAVSRAHGDSTPLLTANASPWHTVMVRPERTTRPRATSFSPRAGAKRLTLNSTVSTSEPGGIKVNAE